MVKNLMLSFSLLAIAVSASAQECTFDAQSELNQCIVDAAAACATSAPNCAAGVGLEHWVVARFKEVCCCKNGAPVSAQKFKLCKTQKLHDLKSVKTLLLNFGTEVTNDIKALTYNQCDVPCDY